MSEMTYEEAVEKYTRLGKVMENLERDEAEYQRQIDELKDKLQTTRSRMDRVGDQLSDLELQFDDMQDNDVVAIQRAEMNFGA